MPRLGCSVIKPTTFPHRLGGPISAHSNQSTSARTNDDPGGSPLGDLEALAELGEVENLFDDRHRIDEAQLPLAGCDESVNRNQGTQSGAINGSGQGHIDVDAGMMRLHRSADIVPE